MCKNAGVGCVACKKNLAAKINEFLQPIRERRKHYEVKPDDVKSILMAGTEKVQQIAKQTVEEVREAMGIKFF